MKKAFLWSLLLITPLTHPVSISTILGKIPIINKNFQTSESNQNQVVDPIIANIFLTNDEACFDNAYKNLINAAKEPKISAILLIINNQGGSLDLYCSLHDLIKKITTIKPVVGLIIGSALSGGYLAASATDFIMAHNGSEIGNIGVFSTIMKYQSPKKTGKVEALLSAETFSAGTFKTIHNSYTSALSTTEKEYIQWTINNCYDLFIQLVAQDRNLAIADSSQWADGKYFLAAQALELRLIDSIGTIFDAEEKIIEFLSERNPDTEFSKNVIYHTYEVEKETK